MKATAKEKNIIKVMESNWESLKTHTTAILEPTRAPKKLIRTTIGGKDFDKKCIREYADNIKMLADIL